jgi:phospholipid/cholesterol/gamma-HCH transport system permease protein
MTESQLKFEQVENKDGILKVRLSGRLSAKTAGSVWKEANELAQETKMQQFVLDVSGLDYCDMTGIGFMHDLKMSLEAAKVNFRIDGLRTEYKNLFDLATQRSAKPANVKPVSRDGAVAALGRTVCGFFGDLYDQVAFMGEVVSQVVRAIMKPGSIRWKDVWVFIEKAGVDAVVLVSMTGILIGAIMAFQSALPLKQMGSDVFVANVVAFAVLRELGPLITGIILAGRTGSAIAAEIGTMKINEEVNALTTMGIEPVRFLVVSRILGILFLAPLLTIICDFFGMVGGALVFKSLGYPITTYVNQIVTVVTLRDIFGGIIKSYPFGLAIAGIGCLRGMQTRTGASAVGESTTASVVTGMVMIIILDGVISALYFVLGI